MINPKVDWVTQKYLNLFLIKFKAIYILPDNTKWRCAFDHGHWPCKTRAMILKVHKVKVASSLTVWIVCSWDLFLISTIRSIVVQYLKSGLTSHDAIMNRYTLW